MTIEENVLEAIQRRQAKNRQFQVARSIPNFFGGELIVVDVTKGSESLAGC